MPGWMNIECCKDSLCFEMAKGIPAAFVAFVIGVIAARITYNQFLVARAKLNLDLFERRMKIFQQVWEILSSVVQKSPVERIANFATPFSNILPETRFLFGPEVHEYLTDATRKWVELGALDQERVDVVGTDRQKNIERASELRTWFFNEASEGCKVKFGPYLDFSQWKSKEKKQ